MSAKNAVIQYHPTVGVDYDLIINYGRSWRPLCQEANLPEPRRMSPDPLPPHRTWKKRKVRFAKFGEYTHPEDVAAYLAPQNYESADIWMLLTFAARFPDVQTTIPIVGLGTKIQFFDGAGETLVPCLRWDGFIRKQRLGTISPHKRENKRTLEFLPPKYGFEPAYYYLVSEILPK